MKRTVLLMHTDRAPEFRELEGAARYLFPGETGDPRMPGELTYESLGKVVVPVGFNEEGDPETYAQVRAFAHPDIIEAIKERGERLEVPWGVPS